MQIRPLGDMEYFYWLTGHSTSTNFTMVVNVKGELSDDTIRTVLRILQQRYPLLNATIIPDKKHGAVFIAADREIPFQCTRISDKAPDYCRTDRFPVSVMEKEKAWHFKDADELLLRCHLIRHAPRSATFLFTFHHAIADAPSALLFIQDFFSTAALIADGGQPENQPYADTGPLESHIAVNYKGIKALSGMNIHTLYLNLFRFLPGTVNIAANRKRHPDERHDSIIVSSFDTLKSAAILAGARSHSCSVHSALCAAHLKAIAAEYPDRNKLRTLLLSLVNLRNHPGFIPSPPSLNLTISMIDTFITMKKNSTLWELAKIIQQQTRKMLLQGRHLTYFPALCRTIHATSWMYDGSIRSSKRFVRLGSLTRPEAVTVSNIGTTSLTDRYGPFTLDNVSFLMSLSTSGIFGSGINSFKGRLNWNFTYASPSLTGKQGERLAKNSRRFLLSACGIDTNGEY